MEFYQLFILIIFFSTIQSIIGVGLLLFGTPALLLLGYSYPEVLWILLPCSCMLSLTQIFESFDLIESKRNVLFLTLPPLVISLIIVINLNYIIDIKKIVGSVLVIIALIRIFKLPKTFVSIFLEKFRGISYIIIGLIHGFSNLGGAPLSAIVSATYSSRQQVNGNIAFAYFILALSQLVILYWYESDGFKYSNLIFIPLVLANHWFFSKVWSSKIGMSGFRQFTTLIILVFGIICLL